MPAIDLVIQDFRDFLQGLGWEVLPDQQIEADDTKHRLRAGDDKTARSTHIVYCLMVDSDDAVGWVRNHKLGEMKEYIFKDPNRKALSPEELKAQRKKQADQKARRTAGIEAEWEAAAKKAQDYWDKSEVLFDSHAYLEKKGIELPDIREDSKGSLVIPLRDIDGKIWSYQTIDAKGDKYYLKGGKKNSAFFLDTRSDDDYSVIFICEGVSTGASIKKGVGNHPVFCALDTSNLKPTAKAVRKEYPKSTIFLACDDDRFGSSDKNAGITYGQAAALSVKGHAIAPVFKSDKNKPTDFNDLHKEEGIEQVSQQISAAVAQATPVPLPESPAPESSMPSGLEGVQTGAGGYPIEFTRLPFRPMGMDGLKYYIYVYSKMQVVTFSSTDLSRMSSLRNIASNAEWEMAIKSLGFMKESDMKEQRIASIASDIIITECNRLGIYDEAERVRGVGAWRDAGRSILHCGAHAYMDGKKYELTEIPSRYIYTQRTKMCDLHPNPLTSEEGKRLFDITQQLNWENPLSAYLLAGWITLAPVCGILDWRPHIWISGESGAGKSTILDQIIKPSLGNLSLAVDGGSTEPGVRGKMDKDARPIVFEESESKDKRQKGNVDAILDLARNSSSNEGNRILKYGMDGVMARWCFCFSCVNPVMNDEVYLSRIEQLTIVKNKSADAPQKFADLTEDIALLIGKDGEFAKRLLARTVNMIPQLYENINIFKKTIKNDIRGAARFAEQMGSLLAGYYTLTNDGIAKPEDVYELIKPFQLAEKLADNSEPDSRALIREITQTVIKVGDKNNMATEYQMGDLIAQVIKPYDKSLPVELAEAKLKEYSIRVMDGDVRIGQSNKNMKNILRNTKWEFGWINVLKTITGAQVKANTRISNIDRQTCVFLPQDYFVDNSNPLMNPDD